MQTFSLLFSSVVYDFCYFKKTDLLSKQNIFIING